MSKKITAWAWRSGLIEFGGSTPEGALPIIHGDEVRVREIVDVLARHGKGESKDQLLVPGVPEATDADEACDALIAFSERVREQMA